MHFDLWSLVIGVLLGFLVLPRLLAAVSGRKSVAA
jgi:hypothetical protein